MIIWHNAPFPFKVTIKYIETLLLIFLSDFSWTDSMLAKKNELIPYYKFWNYW